MGGIAFQVAKKKLVDYNFFHWLDAPGLRAVLAVLPGVDVRSIKVRPPPAPHVTRGCPPRSSWLAFAAAAEHGLLVRADPAPLSLPGGASSTQVCAFCM